MTLKIILLTTGLLGAVSLKAQEVLPLYENLPPRGKLSNEKEIIEEREGRLYISKVSSPTISIFLPPKEKATGTAVIICPGGGYTLLAFTHEGTDVAKLFNEWGVAAIVLKYRLPDDGIMLKKDIGPLQDAQRAIQMVRENASRWSINPKKIGIMGFSAGGHLASTAGTHFDRPQIPNFKKTGLRPDFMILAYPVISFSDSLGHKWSRKKLLGDTASNEQIRYFSNELQVNRKTPKTFLMHAKDDMGVLVGNSESFYEALKAHNVPAEIFLYDKGGHGFGLNNSSSSDNWMNHVKQWMLKEKIL